MGQIANQMLIDAIYKLIGKIKTNKAEKKAKKEGSEEKESEDNKNR